MSLVSKNITEWVMSTVLWHCILKICRWCTHDLCLFQSYSTCIFKWRFPYDIMVGLSLTSWVVIQVPLCNRLPVPHSCCKRWLKWGSGVAWLIMCHHTWLCAHDINHWFSWPCYIQATTVCPEDCWLQQKVKIICHYKLWQDHEGFMGF